MDPNARGVLVGLATMIAVCGAVLHWVHHNSAAPMDFIERHFGFSPDDGSMEVLVFTVLVLIITTVALRWASK